MHINFSLSPIASVCNFSTSHLRAIARRRGQSLPSSDSITLDAPFSEYGINLRRASDSILPEFNGLQSVSTTPPPRPRRTSKVVGTDSILEEIIEGSEDNISTRCMSSTNVDSGYSRSTSSHSTKISSEESKSDQGQITVFGVDNRAFTDNEEDDFLFDNATESGSFVTRL